MAPPIGEEITRSEKAMKSTSQAAPIAGLRCAHAFRSAFTLVEVLLAMFIFAGVLAAIYASWTAILRASAAVRGAAAETQRSRIGVRALEEGLSSIQFSPPNARHYAFVADTSGDQASLSFVAHLPKSYPRSGRFGDQQVRRLTFTVEPDASGQESLMLRQVPLLFEPDRDEVENPLVLARNVVLFHLEFWGPNSRDWEQEWPWTNQIPRLLKFSLATAPTGASRIDAEDVLSRVLVLPVASAAATVGFIPPLQPGLPGMTNLPVVPGGQVPPPNTAPIPR